MNPLRSRVLAVSAAALVLAGGVDAATYAATGHSLLLGAANSASRSTTLTRTTAGPALTFKTRAGSAPFAVQSSTKVRSLNADRLDGFDGSALATRTTTYQDAGQQDRGNVENWPLPLARGSYLISYSVPMAPATGTAAAPNEASCSINVGTATYAVSTGTRTENTFPFLTGSAAVTVTAGSSPHIYCQVFTGTFSLTDGGVARVDVTPINGRKVKAFSGS